jgi:hypothetical protein
MLVASAPAFGASSQWLAEWAGNPPGYTVESGETFQTFIRAKNLGSATWNQGPVRLGTVGPTENPASGQDRASAFADETWLSYNRAATLAEASVPPGGVGTFNFQMRAPVVTQRFDFKEYFAPVAEGIDWMYQCPQWCGVHIFGTVHPAQDPRITAAAPRSVTRGEPIPVTADAQDNVRVDRVVFSLGEQDVRDDAAPFEASFSSADLTPGSNSVTARAFDGVGNSDSDVASFTVKPAPATTPAAEAPPSVGVSINEGARYTNTRDVRLLLRPPPGATGALVSNDGLLDAAMSTPLEGETTIAWTLGEASRGPAVRTVYVRFTGPGLDPSAVPFDDDIDLDETRPAIDRIEVGSSRRGNRKIAQAAARPEGLAKGEVRCRRTALLTVRAHDDLSGVDQLVYGFRPGSLSEAERFRGRLRISLPRRLGKPKMYVQVRDGATNLSKRRPVNLRQVCR